MVLRAWVCDCGEHGHGRLRPRPPGEPVFRRRKDCELGAARLGHQARQRLVVEAVAHLCRRADSPTSRRSRWERPASRTAGGLRVLSAAEPCTDESRRLYRGCRMRMSRSMADIKSRENLTPAELAFRDLPGSLLCDGRVAAWLRLSHAAEPLARAGADPRRGAGRPAVASVAGQNARWARDPRVSLHGTATRASRCMARLA